MKRVLLTSGSVRNRAGLVPMTVPCVRLTLLTLIVGFWSALPARADIMTPAGLNPGDQFRIIFVTSAIRNAISSNIADYDAFVTNLANAAGLTYNGDPVTWQALGSTSFVFAISNGRLPADASSPPLYRLDGVKVADNTADLWDGTLDAPINVDEFGTGGIARLVWTGTAPNGFPAAPLGFAVGTTTFGASIYTHSEWVEHSVPSQQFNNYSIYGYSQVLTVVPEPTSLTLVLMGLAGLAGASVARWRRGP